MILGPDVVVPTRGNEHDGLADVEQDPAQPFIDADSVQYENDDDDDVVEVVQFKKTYEVIQIDDDHDGVAPGVALRPTTPKHPKTSGPVAAPTPIEEPRPGPSSLSRGVSALRLEEATDVGKDKKTSRPTPVRRRRVFISSSDDSSSSDTDATPLPRGPPPLPLLQQLNAIYEEMRIPQSTFEAAMDLKEKLRTALTFAHPNCDLKLFRNWYLKLKSCDPDYLLLFLDYNGKQSWKMIQNQVNHRELSNSNFILIFAEPVNAEGASVPSPIPRADKKDKITFRDFRRFFEAQDGNFLICRQLSMQIRNEDELGQTFLHKPSNLSFNIVNNPAYILEVQTCRLLEYLLTCDPRAKPMLTLIRYWAKVNNIRFTKPDGQFTPGFPPDPAILDWFVMIYLCEKKIIPSPRQLCLKPHEVVMYSGRDIGFSADPEFAKECALDYEKTNEKAFSVDVLTLARKWFEFFGREFGEHGCKNVFLNTRDGEILPGERFTNLECRMTYVETCSIKRSSHKENLTRANAQPGERVVTMINPLFVEEGFALCSKTMVSSVQPSMEKTGMELGGWIDKLDLKSALLIK